jgi:uncharacterized protein (DUF433 family)
MSVAAPGHIWIDAAGVAWIDQTNIKVIEVALERLAHGSSVEDIVEQHEGLLTMGQVHAALAHYYDYSETFDAVIRMQLERADRLRAESLSSPSRKKLARSGP